MSYVDIYSKETRERSLSFVETIRKIGFRSRDIVIIVASYYNVTNVSEIEMLTGVPRSSIYRSLRFLKERGSLVKEGSNYVWDPEDRQDAIKVKQEVERTIRKLETRRYRRYSYS